MSEVRITPLHSSVPPVADTNEVHFTDLRMNRSQQIQINRTAHTSDFKPGAYQAAKLSDDAAQLLADFIQRPAIRAQLQPLLGRVVTSRLPPVWEGIESPLDFPLRVRLVMSSVNRGNHLVYRGSTRACRPNLQ